MPTPNESAPAEEERRAADQDTAIEEAFVAGTLPEEDRRTVEQIMEDDAKAEALFQGEVPGETVPVVPMHPDVLAKLSVDDTPAPLRELTPTERAVELIKLAQQDTGYAQHAHLKEARLILEKVILSLV